MPQQSYGGHFGHSNGGVDPNDLTVGMNGGSYGQHHSDAFAIQQANANGGYAKGISSFNDDELLESLGDQELSEQFASSHDGGDFGINVPFSSSYVQHDGLPITSHSISGFSHTPEGDPIQSPFVHNFNQAQFRHMQTNSFAPSLHSPGSFSGSPLLGPDGQMGDAAFNKQQRPRLGSVVPGRRSSITKSPLTPKIGGISALSIGPAEQQGFTGHPMRTSQPRHGRTLSNQWDQTPSSLHSYADSEFGSPIPGLHGNPQIADVLKPGSMPAKLGSGVGLGAPPQNSIEAKRRRRRESHNLVERRRRDNINERIQELSSLVPQHRLEDEKIRKALVTNSPLSPTLVGMSSLPNDLSPPGPGLARRNTAGTITTGIPIDDKDKGPNKGDILNGAVSWTQDLMWMLHTKLQQQEELANIITELGGVFPFEPTENERRMHTELHDALTKNPSVDFSYSRFAGSGLRVPKHTDIKGDSLTGVMGHFENSLSPDNHSGGDMDRQPGMGGPGQYWSGNNSGGSVTGSVTFKEEDEYGMDLTQ